MRFTTARLFRRRPDTLGAPAAAQWVGLLSGVAEGASPWGGAPNKKIPCAATTKYSRALSLRGGNQSGCASLGSGIAPSNSSQPNFFKGVSVTVNINSPTIVFPSVGDWGRTASWAGPLLGNPECTPANFLSGDDEVFGENEQRRRLTIAAAPPSAAPPPAHCYNDDDPQSGRLKPKASAAARTSAETDSRPAPPAGGSTQNQTARMMDSVCGARGCNGPVFSTGDKCARYSREDDPRK